MLVDEGLLRTADLLPDDDVLVLEELGRALAGKLRWILCRRRFGVLRGEARDRKDDRDAADDQRATNLTISIDSRCTSGKERVETG